VTSDAWYRIGLLAAHHSEAGTHAHVLKLSEEVGEAAAALIGLNGWNRRKGVNATVDDLLDELGDVIITAAVAMTGITGDPTAAEQRFQRRLAAVVERAQL
jgi:NTP pyrophosphatase (non-canonical NTP hydrolase)